MKRGQSRDVWEGDQPVEREGYLTDLISDRAAALIGEQPADQPFMMSVHYTAPH